MDEDQQMRRKVAQASGSGQQREPASKTPPELSQCPLGLHSILQPYEGSLRQNGQDCSPIELALQSLTASLLAVLC